MIGRSGEEVECLRKEIVFLRSWKRGVAIRRWGSRPWVGVDFQATDKT